MLARAGVGPGDTVLWLGATGAAVLGMAITAAKGAIGHVIDEPVAADELRARVATEPGAIPWKVMETSGGDDGRRRAIALARFGATVVLASADAAGADDDGPLALGAALDADVTLLAVAAPHPDLVPETAALVGRAELALDGARVFAIADLAEALSHARTGALTVVSMR
jgi:D-arabinose 1-dehydrogenase-like Zn-dependent alcohol dehydrogenase